MLSWTFDNYGEVQNFRNLHTQRFRNRLVRSCLKRRTKSGIFSHRFEELLLDAIHPDFFFHSAKGWLPFCHCSQVAEGRLFCLFHRAGVDGGGSNAQAREHRAAGVQTVGIDGRARRGIYEQVCTSRIADGTVVVATSPERNVVLGDVVVGRIPAVSGILMPIVVTLVGRVLADERSDTNPVMS